MHMKGTVYYLWEAMNLSFAATFRVDGKVSGSKIVSTSDAWRVDKYYFLYKLNCTVLKNVP